MFLHWKLVDPWQLSCVCVVRPPTTSHVTPLLLRSGLPIKRGKTIGGTWIVYTSIVKAAFNYDIPVGLLHSFLSLPPFFHSPLGASRLPQKENDYVIMIPEKKWWWCVLLHHFGAHNLIPLAFYDSWLQTYSILTDWLNIKTTASFCISKWKSLELGIKNGQRVHSLSDETFKFLFFWCKFFWWKPWGKCYLVHTSFESLCMLLPLPYFTKMLQWLQWHFVISWTPHSWRLPSLCSEHQCCWVEHRSLVA